MGNPERSSSGQVALVIAAIGAVATIIAALVGVLPTILSSKADKPGDSPSGLLPSQPDGKKAGPTSSKISAPSVTTGSIWEGTLIGFAKDARPYPGSLSVTDRSGDTFRGIFSFGDGVVEVEGQLNGDEISFRDTKLVQGKNLALPAVQTGHVREDLMNGTWWHSHTANGKFEFARRKSD